MCVSQCNGNVGICKHAQTHHEHKQVEKLRIYREAELKHGRLAMLAALGWPASEALDKPLASAMGMKSLLVSTPVGVANGVAEQGEALLRAPSLLNGGAFNKYT